MIPSILGVVGRLLATIAGPLLGYLAGRRAAQADQAEERVDEIHRAAAAARRAEFDDDYLERLRRKYRR